MFFKSMVYTLRVTFDRLTFNKFCLCIDFTSFRPETCQIPLKIYLIKDQLLCSQEVRPAQSFSKAFPFRFGQSSKKHERMEALDFQFQDSTGKPVTLKEDQVEDSDAEKQWCAICKRYFIFRV